MIPVSPESLSRVEIKQAFRRAPRGTKQKLANELGKPLSRISDWFGKRGASPDIDRAIRQRAADLINESSSQERREAQTA